MMLLTLLLLTCCLSPLRGHQLRVRWAVSDGRVRTKYFDTGNIGGTDEPSPLLEWPAGSGNFYLYQAAFFVGARVKARAADSSIIPIWIFDDAIQDGGDGDFSPAEGYAAPLSDTLALSTSTSTWPDIWPPFITAWGDTISNLSGSWAGEFGQPSPITHQEGFYVLTDSINREFSSGNPANNPVYDPGNGLAGLGLKVFVHSYVVTVDSASNAIVFSYIIQNVSDKRIDSMVVGVFADPLIGGETDADDDAIDYHADIRTVRFFDKDGIGFTSDGPPCSCGQSGIVFLLTPGNDHDGMDNDGDGMIDESPDDGIDNDGDWNPSTDDVGRDGMPGTGDEGEGNGIPDPGEPHFEWRDPDEFDELGISSVAIRECCSLPLDSDSLLGTLTVPEHYTPIDSTPDGNLIVLASSGYFSLDPGEWTRFVYAYIFSNGGRWEDTWLNWAQTVSYFRNYLGIGTEGATAPMIPLEIYRPATGERLRGSNPISWSYAATEASVSIEVSDDDFKSSGHILHLAPNSGHTSWCTRDWPDGSLYRMRITVFDPFAGGGSATTGFFTIDNPDANGEPAVIVSSPSVLREVVRIPCIIGDPEADSFALTLKLTSDGGRNWTEFYTSTFSTERETVKISLDTRAFPNTDSAFIMAVVSSPEGADTDMVGPLRIENWRRFVAPDSFLAHIAGDGDGQITVALQGNPATNDTFMLTFGSQLTYSLYDITADSAVFLDYPLIEGMESPRFYNISLFVSTFHDTVYSDSLSGHMFGSSNFELQATLPDGGVPLPSDYTIEFHDSMVGRAFYRSTLSDSMSIVPVNFIIVASAGNDTLTPILLDTVTRDTAITASGEAIALMCDSVPSWTFIFRVQDSVRPAPPSGGDVYFVKILKPFSERDTFLLFSPLLPGVGESSIGSANEISLSGNVFSSQQVLTLQLNGRPDEKIEVRIVDASGRTLRRHQLRGGGKVSLSLKGLASGIYFLTIKKGGSLQAEKILLMR